MSVLTAPLRIAQGATPVGLPVSLDVDRRDPSLTFWHNFAHDQSLAGRKGPPISWTRNTNAWDFDSDGNRAVFTANNPRFGYTPQTGAVNFGAAVFQAIENFMLHNGDWTDAVYDTVTDITPLKDAVGLDGVANSASTLTATGANGVIRQSITLTSAERNYSVWVRRKTGTGTIEITDNGGTNYTDITSLINSSTYTPVDITRTQANPDIGFRIVTSGDEIEVDDGHVTTTSSRYGLPIPTGASSVVVDADAANTTDVTFHSGGAGTWFAKISYPVSRPAGRALQIDDGGNTDLEALVLQVNGSLRCFVTASAGNNASPEGSIIAAGTQSKGAFAYTTDDLAFYQDGTNEGTDTTVDFPSDALTTFNLGQRTGGNDMLNGHIAEIRYYNVRKSNAFLDQITT